MRSYIDTPQGLCKSCFLHPWRMQELIYSNEHLYFSGVDSGPIAIIVLNQPQNSALLSTLWQLSSLKVFADGAGTRMFRDLPARLKDLLIPDAICGDLDSLSDSARLHYESRGAHIVKVSEQDSTDLMKSIDWIRGRCGDSAPSWSVIVVGPFGGRLDHTMQNLNTLFRYDGVFRRFTMLSEDCLAVLLRPGCTAIDLCVPCEGPTVGLIPLGAPVATVTTKGLKWNLDGEGTAFGNGNVLSTSNHVLAWDDWLGGGVRDSASSSCPSSGAREPCVLRRAVEVTTSGPLIWTCAVDCEAVVEQLEARARAALCIVVPPS